MGKRQPPTGQWVAQLANVNPAQDRWERKEAERLREIKHKKRERKKYGKFNYKGNKR